MNIGKTRGHQIQLEYHRGKNKEKIKNNQATITVIVIIIVAKTINKCARVKQYSARCTLKLEKSATTAASMAASAARQSRANARAKVVIAPGRWALREQSWAAKAIEVWLLWKRIWNHHIFSDLSTIKEEHNKQKKKRKKEKKKRKKRNIYRNLIYSKKTCK